MASTTRLWNGPARIMLVIAALTTTLSGVFAAPSVAATPCGPIWVSSSGTIPVPAKLVEFAAGANGNVAPANTVGGPRNSRMVTASGIAEDSDGFVYVVSPHINSIEVYPPGASGDVSPFAILKGTNTGLNNPQGLVVRGDRLYVVNGPFGSGLSGEPSVAVFALPLTFGLHNVAPVAVIAGPATGLVSPYGLALDASGNIFVANVNNTVTEYAPPGPSSYAAPDNAAPILTMSDGLVAPEGLAIHAGVLYAANDNHTITEYSLPTGTRIATIAGPDTLLFRPTGIDVDSAGKIYVANNGTRVLVFGAGSDGDVAPIAVIGGPATLLLSAQFVYIARCSGTPPPPGSLSITTGSLPAATVGTAYSQSLGATGGTAPYTWSLASGTLPAGLSLSTAGVISGSPTSAGTSAFTVKVGDAANPAQSATKSLSLAVTSVVSPLKVTTRSLPAAKVGVAYSVSLAATGGTPPYSWSRRAGALPAGLSLSSSGVISGTPTTAGTASFTVKATDASNPVQSAKKALSLAVT